MGRGRSSGEPVFVPSADPKGEDDGYLITLVTDSRDWSSWCLVFDATDIEPGPLARVRMPQRVPYGFHAAWVRGVDLFASAS